MEFCAFGALEIGQTLDGLHQEASWNERFRTEKGLQNDNRTDEAEMLMRLPSQSGSMVVPTVQE
jgi:hypothetical protein